MEFENNQSIYIQIADNLSDKIINEEYKPGEKIPSVRELAAEVGVNPNTIMRTYTELQSKGIIENKRGIGYFVTSIAPECIIKERKINFFEKILPQFIKEASQLGITQEELKKHLDL
ncbi:GntR family transcriptional regulator [Antarcticibacterium sp. 1MA-6-2]|uniref:GntR family transcriptional regulator n=1 Tax=Antarcticibacterium sp. 1MA-6-2 TaxID=2908210 RepID=UPI001F19377E|nr:GntR family transcriptional regulator [Antarcticibacterium sp. 1MA-6-2]UJH92100.1 GntR family transcriptional regulator [Antarcticibacterium sp. 1MA-6-2]